ncbi:F-box/WD repeat-containing protein 5 isoform X2 [Bacillus rossius redtenbacheri]|uniref:F-box/WD repeat-containing protein 5 isoform X2 n=1 Tax=Bacillus rossius redtenbacheri TaxID=93214 RepID=UPI002FDD2BDB
MEEDGLSGDGGDDGAWCFLPDTLLLHIFKYLSAHELLVAGLACWSWRRVSLDQFLWRDLLRGDFCVEPSVGIAPGRSSWFHEYKRLHHEIPLVQTEDLREHSHQVLHVSFSHNGKMFATCSKDGYILVWNASYPASMKYHHDMKAFSWKYTQFSQFNESDTLLLVSGVHFGSPHSMSGEIAVFSLQDDFALQCRVMNKPYDVFGAWYSDGCLLSGDLHWLAHLVSTSVLWLNRASQESSSEHVPIMRRLCHFYNASASSVRSVLVAPCLAPAPQPEGSPATEPRPAGEPGGAGAGERGNPPSHRVQMLRVSSALQCTSLDRAFHNWRRLSDGQEYACPIYYNAQYRQVEMAGRESDASEEEPSNSESEMDAEQSDTSGDARDCEGDTEEGEEVPESREKYLIFTTGCKTYTPHQIGFKRIEAVTFPRKMSPGPSLRERLARRERERESRQLRDPDAEPNWLVYEEVADRFDKVDHLIDLHGHIIGMGLSPDRSRPWPQGYTITNPLDPPPIAQEIDIHVIDLVTLKEVGTMLRSHKAYTPNNDCFFIFLDVCSEYVASGAEDRHGYLWDRHYGACLAKFPHCDVVNAVAFNPRDPQMLVTVSDDFSVKVWRSQRRAGQLGLDAGALPRGLRVRQRRRRPPPADARAPVQQ